MSVISIVINVLSVFSPVFVLVFGRNNKTLLWWYAATAFVFDLNSFIGKYAGYKIVWQGNLLMLVEFAFLCWYFKRMFVNKKLFYLISVLLACVFIVHTLCIRPYDMSVPVSRLRFNLTAAAILYLWYIILAIIGFYKLITGPLIDDILKSGFFWVNVAFLIYASGVFFMFMFAETIRKQDIALGALLWSTVFCGLNIIKNILLAKALSIKNGPVEP